MVNKYVCSECVYSEKWINTMIYIRLEEILY